MTLEGDARTTKNPRDRYERGPNFPRALAYGLTPERTRVMDVVHRFIMAAVRSETICHLRLTSERGWKLRLPIQALVDFCHENRNIKVLEMETVAFVSDRRGDHNVDLTPTTTLDRLILDYVIFDDEELWDLSPFLKCTELVLGQVREVLAFRYPDDSLPKQEILMTQLTLHASCDCYTFQAVLTRGQACVEALTVDLDDDRALFGSDDDENDKFDVLATAMPDKLEVLHVNFGHPLHPQEPRDERTVPRSDRCM